MLIPASEAARITGGTLVGADVLADGLSFDSRSLQAGQCFIALVAERDGHEFVDNAFAGGATLAITRRGTLAVEDVPPGCGRIDVDDTMQALTDLGRWARRQLDESARGRVIGVTGSAGKTSTKDFITAVLRRCCTTSFASEMSYNNDIGVPTTLVNAPDNCDAIVLEMGMRGFGEISRLCEIARPHVGVITSIGEAHSDRVGGIEGVARAKGELFEALPTDGIAVACADDPRAMRALSQSQAPGLTFGMAHDAHVRYEVLSIDNDGCATIAVYFSGDQQTVVVPVPGVHMASNAVAAIAVGIAIGCDFRKCVGAIVEVELSQMRMQWMSVAGGIRVMNDAYNANPDSMIAALKTLAVVPTSMHVAVVGVMAEIADAPERHRFVAERARELGIDLWPVGTDLYGIAPISIQEAAQRIKMLPEGSAVLLKGSRVAGLERVVDLLGVAPPREK
jgi:UDP-N-acetylmuramoyl-tripeptide--D-alanyl-D-alanine ligase